MNDDLVKLKHITRTILNPEKQLKDLIVEAQELRDLFEGRTNFQIHPEEGIGAGETRLQSGLAISPTTAAMCIRELFRTCAFIRGLGEAIRDSMHSKQPVRVLYAGCGPYALLAVPLMTAFSKEQVVFTLLDVHRQCLGDAKKLIDSFGLSGYVDDYLCVDATTYRIPDDKKPDIIVSETMSVALHNEPQVSIARNLLSQVSSAKMVPQQISVELCLVNGAKEHVFMPADFVGEFPEPERDRIYLGNVFELSVLSIQGWDKIDGDRLPASRIKIPSPINRKYRLHFLTKITVYKQTRLDDYDCSLTMPKPLRGEIQGGEMLQFYYCLGNHPELRYDKVS